MTIIAPMILVCFFVSWVAKAKNPVKTSVSILITAVSMFILMALFTGSTWVPILMTMLFMGGIIMMFMILSSVLPNEKSGKLKNMMTLTGPMLVLLMMGLSESLGDLSGESFQAFLTSGVSFWLMMSFILIYFLSSMSILSSESTPMRALYCC